MKTCFIISSIGKEGSDTRTKADEKYDLVFEPVLRELGYTVTRADKIGSPGSISREIVEQIISSNLVIADVSDENPNVFYELAIRNAVKKPVIVFKGLEQTMPFDIYDKRAISIDMTKPRIWENAKNALRTHIKECENKPDLASESILSDFVFEINNQKTPRTEQDMVRLLIKDIKEELRKIQNEIASRYVTREESKFKAISDWIATKQYLISIPHGSSNPDHCKDNECYTPAILTIKRGSKVIWVNEDSAGHTVTQGNPQQGPGGYFDSSLLSPGASFERGFPDKGEFEYFCVVHPWQIGKIIVEE
jgi:plastocyanin